MNDTNWGLGIVTLLAIPAFVAMLVAVGLIIRLVCWLSWRGFNYVWHCNEVKTLKEKQND